MTDLQRLLRSLPHLRPTQVTQRGWRLSAETVLLSLGGLRLARTPPSRLTAEGADPRRSPRFALWSLRKDQAERVAADAAIRTFEFVGVRREDVRGPGWIDPSASRLWRFNLNAFQWAWAMAAAGAERWGQALAALVEEWRTSNPPRRGDAWHPIVAAERLVSLLGTRAIWFPYVQDPGPMSAWLWQHALLVRTALERDVGGNHLIREATALAAAGIAFGSRSMEWAGLRLVAGAVGRQILPDGGHEERSPSYHLEVLTDLAEVRSLLPANHPFRDSLGHMLGRMADFAASFCHPDGELPLFNDCSPWPVRVTAFLRALGLEPRPRSRFPESGYYILGTGETALFFDAGPPSPPDLPPHAHCDLLSFEASVGGRRLLVNSGTGDYARGSWRDYWRSTRAHNTVEVDRQEQSEVWHSFRMARRASPSDVETIETDDGEIVTAAHDGYRRLSPGVVHRRTVARWPPGWVVVDSLEGTGRHTFRSFLHLHAAASHTELHCTHLLERGGSLLRVCPLGGFPVSLVDARREPLENWFAPGLGKREPGRALVMEATVTLPAVFGWVLSIGDHEVRAGIRPVEDGVRVTVQDAGNVRVIDLLQATGGRWATSA